MRSLSKKAISDFQFFDYGNFLKLFVAKKGFLEKIIKILEENMIPNTFEFLKNFQKISIFFQNQNFSKIYSKVNDVLNNPSRGGSHVRGGDDAEGHLPEALMQLLSSSGASSQSQIQQLQSLLQQTQQRGSSSMRSSSSSSSSKKEDKPKPKIEPKQEPTQPTSTNTTPAASTSQTPVQIEDLQSILRNMTGAGPAQTPIDIAEAMKAEDIIPMLANEQIREKLSAHLPADSSIPKTEAELKDTLRSPQFQQACDAFSHALSSGQLGPALAQFGVSQAAVDAANKGDVRAFAAAMEKDQKKDENNEEQMQTD